MPEELRLSLVRLAARPEGGPDGAVIGGPVGAVIGGPRGAVIGGPLEAALVSAPLRLPKNQKEMGWKSSAIVRK